MVLEPRLGGRWYERAADGTTCNWGHVVAWEPPARLVLTWEIDAAWKANPAVKSEVEVRFVSESPTTTRVELEHRDLHVFGDARDAVRGQLDGEGGWQALLGLFAARVAA